MVWCEEMFFLGGAGKQCSLVLNKFGFKMGPLPPLDSQEFTELIIRTINCSISLFYSLRGKVTKIHKRLSMNEPGKNRADTCLATLLLFRVLEFQMRKQKEQISSNYPLNVSSAKGRRSLCLFFTNMPLSVCSIPSNSCC